MNINHSTSRHGILTVQITGNMDANGCALIEQDLLLLVDNIKEKHASLDLMDVNVIDSSGVGVIVYLFKRLLEHKQTMDLINVHGQPLEFMELLHIDTAIPITELNEAENQMAGYTQCAI